MSSQLPDTDSSPPKFNFRAPVLLPDGEILIIPTFAPTGPKNKRLAVIRNCELPSKLRVAGELTDEEDREIQYYKLKSGQPILIGWDAENAIFTGMYWNERDISILLPLVWDMMEDLRKSAFRRVPGSQFCELEIIVAGGEENINPDDRTYSLGFFVNPQGLSAGAFATNAQRLADTPTIAMLTTMCSMITVGLLQASVPETLLTMLARQSEIDVPLLAGHEKNYFFNAFQFNFSDVNNVKLSNSLGDFGELHVDRNDDPARWSVLLGLSNYAGNCWPGRMCLTGLRLYAVMAPMTALVFQGGQPHYPTPPKEIVDTDRQPYVPSLEIAQSDPQQYSFGRFGLVGYPKNAIMDRSPLIIRNVTPQIQKGPNGEISNQPDRGRAGNAAFGSDRNKHEFFARSYAWNLTSLAADDEDTVIPTAAEIAAVHRWKNPITKNIETPDLARIQIVLDRLIVTEDNVVQAIQYQIWRAKCKAVLSQGWFPGKTGTIAWVDQPGSSLQGMDADAARRANAAAELEIIKPLRKKQVHEQFGPRPYKCAKSGCEERFPKIRACKVHNNKTHLGNEFVKPEPSIDPDFVDGVKVEEDEEADDGDGHEEYGPRNSPPTDGSRSLKLRFRVSRKEAVEEVEDEDEMELD